jgi:hypothetical protein
MSNLTWKQFLENLAEDKIFDVNLRETFVKKYVEYNNLKEWRKGFINTSVDGKRFTEIYRIFEKYCPALKETTKDKFEILGQWLKDECNANQNLISVTKTTSKLSSKDESNDEDHSGASGNLSSRGRNSKEFFGRDETLQQLHDRLQANNQLSLTALRGMGGIGKTELAIQYAKKYSQNYPGGTWWLSVPADKLGIDITTITKSRLVSLFIRGDNR